MEEEAVTKAEEGKRKSVPHERSILGGDILATDFPPADEAVGADYGIHHLLHP